jgi:hypothetical protein
MHDVDSIEGALEQATGPQGMLEGMMRLREEGEIAHVSFVSPAASLLHTHSKAYCNCHSG